MEARSGGVFLRVEQGDVAPVLAPGVPLVGVDVLLMPAQVLAECEEVEQANLEPAVPPLLPDVRMCFCFEGIACYDDRLFRHYYVTAYFAVCDRGLGC